MRDGHKPRLQTYAKVAQFMVLEPKVMLLHAQQTSMLFTEVCTPDMLALINYHQSYGGEWTSGDLLQS